MACDHAVEGGLQELHGAAGPGLVFSAVDAGCVEPAVVGFHLADAGQDAPVQPGAYGGSLAVEREVVGGNVGQGGLAGLAGVGADER